MTPGFNSPLDDERVFLSIAARLVLHYVHVVPLVRLDKIQCQAPLSDGEDLDQWSIRRGDLRTALRLIGDR